MGIFLTNRPSLVTKTTIIPGLGDHDIVLTDSCIKAAKLRPIVRKISTWKKLTLTPFATIPEHSAPTLEKSVSGTTVAVESLTPNDHDGEVCPNKNMLHKTSPTLDKQQTEKTVLMQIQSLETCQNGQ